MSPGRSSEIATVLVLLCLVAYSPIWENDFFDLDDGFYITQNSHVYGGLSVENICWAWSTLHCGYWIPLVWMTLQLDASVSNALGAINGLAPCVYHGQNLFWHCLTTVLLYLTLQRMTGSRWPSVCVAALFAVHPLHVESVAWATERKDVLSAFFWVLAIARYASYAAAPTLGRYLLVLFCLTLGLLAKPMLVTLPCVFVLLDYWPLRRLVVGGADPAATSRPTLWGRRLLLEKIPFFLLVLPASVLAVKAQTQEGGVAALNDYPFSARLANAVESYGWYLKKTILPTELAGFYPHANTNWTWPPVLVSAAVLGVLSLAAVVRARTWPWLFTGWFWFVGTLIPVIGLIQAGSQSRADRFVYIPHIGLFIVLVWGTGVLLDRAKVGVRTRVLLGVGVIFILTGVTINQVGYWREPLIMWQRIVAVSPTYPDGYGVLSQNLAYKFKQTGNVEYLDLALDSARQAYRMKPDEQLYCYHLGMIHFYRGELDEAAERFQDAVRLNPDYAAAWHNLGVTEIFRKHYSEAHDDLRRALELTPHAAEVHSSLGRLYWETKKYENARAEWEEALAGSPMWIDALAGLGNYCLLRGDNEKAAESFEKAIRMDQKNPRLRHLLGTALGRLGRWDEAHVAQTGALQATESLNWPPTALSSLVRRLAFILTAQGNKGEAASFYEHSLRLDPGWPAASLETAWSIATAPEVAPGEAALASEMAGEVCQATNSPTAHDLDVLAAALAAVGRFEDAVNTGRVAIRVAMAADTEPIKSRVALYEMKKRFVRK